MPLINISGKQFGRLTAISRCADGKWVCSCRCGNQKIVARQHLTTGRTSSCGCLNSELSAARKRTHGKARTKVYATWARMINRCINPAASGYANYGGRGILVCEKWKTFKYFYDDMGDPPSDKHSIDRINNDGNYEPSNCRWATRIQQANNTRASIRLSHDGQSMTVAQWAELKGLRANRLWARIFRDKMSIGDAINRILPSRSRPTS